MGTPAAPSPEQVTLAENIRRHKTYQRGMRYYGASPQQNMRAAATTILTDDGHTPLIRELVASVADQLGCSNTEAIIRSLEAVPVP